jgi:hypothetical protein
MESKIDALVTLAEGDSPQPDNGAARELPTPETPVLAWARNYECPIVLELRWERCDPFQEPYFQDYLYWDDPNNDGQEICYEDVLGWEYIAFERPLD